MENLYTEGGELQYLDGKDYIGPYHVLPNGIPMTGEVSSDDSEALEFIGGNIETNPITDISSYLSDGFELQDQSVIPSFQEPSAFDPTTDRIELAIYDQEKRLLRFEQNYGGYTIENAQSTGENSINEIYINPVSDLFYSGYYGQSNLAVFYNFVTSDINNIFISEISPDRTEIRLQSNTLDGLEIIGLVDELTAKIESSNYFDEFYLNLGRNQYYIAVNVLLDTTTTPTSFLIKLYEPLPTSITTKTRAEIVSKVSETIGYEVKFPNKPPQDVGFTGPFLRGPNLNVGVKDKINNSTDFKDLSTLTTSSFTASLAQSEYLLNQTGITLHPSYSISNYTDFVHFSSAKERLENFYYKVGQIESFQNNINDLRTITGPTSASSDVVFSINSFQKKIDDFIKNFDGFEYFLYFNSGSNSYPKSNSTPPFVQQSTGSAEVLTWLGSDIPSNPYYGGALLSASRYDDDNPDWLYYTIPEFIRENADNNNYIKFSNMVGQHFDEIWLYARSITKKLRATNNLETGIQLGIIEETLKSFGYDIYGNNFNNSDIFTGLIGINESGSFFPETGNEVINTYVSASNEPVPIETVSKEIYKRLYHNLIFLAKKKGTIAGLRSLINIWGLPDTILRINEFGGKDKVNSNDWDLYREIYNKEIYKEGNNSVQTSFAYDGTGAQGLNPKWGIDPSVPRTVEFRFKSRTNPNTLPDCTNVTNTPIREELFNLYKLTQQSASLNITLEYFGSGSVTSSYSGSTFDTNNQYADLTLYVSGSTQYYSSSINLPFYNQDWWNVMLQYDSGSNKFELYAGNKIYNGKDGTKLGFTGDTSITVPSYNDTFGYRNASSALLVPRSGPTKHYGLGKSGSLNFSGSVQELRFWTNLLPENAWHNHIMDPLSIETGYLTGSLSPVETLAFRTREGEDLSVTGGTNTSIHPKITGSHPITSSFSSSLGEYSTYTDTGTYQSNTETQFLNNPNLGIKNRITDKIRDYENVTYGNVLSAYRSVQQNYEVSQSYTEDTNLLEVAFSPQDEINDDIIHELGFNNNITETLSDPRNLSSSSNYYDGLRNIALKYFEKYTEADHTDYFRLIKYIDNSLFKAIKNYVPARTSVSTGIVVKQHLLERNRVRPPQVDSNSDIAKTSEGGFNTPLTFQDITLTGSIKSQPKGFTTGSSIEKTTGGTGGSFEKFNSINFTPYGVSGSGPTEKFGYTISQSYTETISTLSGSVTRTRSTQDEFYNGEFSGSILTVTTQSLNPGCDPFKNVFVTPPDTHQFDGFVYQSGITSKAKFDSPQTNPQTPNFTGKDGCVFLYDRNPAGGLSGFARIGGIKVSTRDRSGNDVSNILDGATRLNFDFGTLMVNQIGQGSGFFEYEVLPDPTTINPFNLNTQILNFAFQASGSSGSFDVTIPDVNTNTAINSTILGDYTFENDPNNTFNASSGTFTSPYTLNRVASITGSCNYTASYSGVGDAVTRVTLQIKATNPDRLIDEKQFIFSSGDATFAYSGSFEMTSSLNPEVLLDGQNVFLEGFADVVENEKNTPTGAISFSNVQFEINHPTETGGSARPTLESYEPYFPSNLDYDHSFDCQPLLNNAVNSRPGTLYIDVDYSTGLLNPTNISIITNNNQTIDPALVPDSNYTSKARTLPRYEGVKLSSARLNFYTGPNELILSDGTSWGGDISYGKEPVIEQTKPNFGYFQLLAPTSPEIEDATQVKLKYIINSEGKPFKPLTNSPSFFDVEGTFESGDLVDIALEDSLQTDDPSLTNAAIGINLDTYNTNTKVIKGARRVDPILTSQIVSINDTSSVNAAFDTGSLFFKSNLITTADYSFQAGEFGVKTYLQPQGTGGENYIISASNEGYDPENNYDPITSIWTNETPSITNQTPIRFQLQGNFVVSKCRCRIQIVRKRGLNVTPLTTPIIIDKTGDQEEFFRFSFDYDPSRTDPIIDTGDLTNLDLSAGDEIYAELRIFAGNENGFVNVNDLNFYGKPSNRGVVEVTGRFWSTGSDGFSISSSIQLGTYIDFLQEQPSGTTFKPINEPFSIRIGDEFRFNGLEERTHLVTNVINRGGRVIAEVQPSILPGIDTNQFLLRRYNPDGTSILLDLAPPSSSFSTTKGVIKNISINEKLEENIGNILSRLSEEGTI